MSDIIEIALPIEKTLPYMTAPKVGLKRGATFTFVNTRDNTHITYRTVKSENEYKGKTYTNITVEVMDGSCNETDFRAIGRLSKTGYFTPFNIKKARKGKASVAEVVKRQSVFAWFSRQRWAVTEKGATMPSSFVFKSSGRCACCGRKLTNPDSLAIFLGPVCAGRV